MLTAMVLALVGACPPKTFCNTTGAIAADALFEVEALAANDAWAFGQGAVLHWDGTSWAPVAFPQPERLSAALALAPNDIWVTGGMDAFHWDGATWSRVDKGREDGWAGPIVRLAPGEVWVLSEPFLRVNGTALERLDEKRAKAFAVPGSFVTDGAACGPKDLWVGRSLTESPVLQHFDGATVKRVALPGGRGQIYGISCLDGVAWVFLETQVFRCTEACVSVEAPEGAQLLRGPLGPWVASAEGLHRWDGKRFLKKAELPGRWYGGAARTDSDVWIVGEAGAVAHFDGQKATQNTSVDVGRITQLGATKQGDVWAIGDAGVFTFRNGEWKRIKSFPGKTQWGGRLWADSPTHLWVVSEGRAWRWGGATWADLTPANQSALDVWGRGEGEVYVSTGDQLLRRTKDSWKVIATAPPSWSFGQVVGDAERLAVAVRGPRPEASDGRPTGLADRVLVIDQGGQKTFDLPSREDQLGFVLGELWAASRNGGLSRRVGEKWVELDRDATLFVATPGGAVVTGRAGRGADWDGKTLKPFTLPLADLRVGIATGTTVWLGGEHVVLRRE